MMKNETTQNRVAASLAPSDVSACLRSLKRIAPFISRAEIRVDRMKSCDLSRLIRESPIPLIITCRPSREGGGFLGAEKERVGILIEAMELGCDYLDIEHDIAEGFLRRPSGKTQLIVSRHWNESMPTTFWPVYESFRGRVAAVKLVGTAQRAVDVLPALDLLRRATSPVIGLAMGKAGRISRLLAPWFDSCFLTYGALDERSATAPGQISIAEMTRTYSLHTIGPRTEINLHLCVDEATAKRVSEWNASANATNQAHFPWVISEKEAMQIVPWLRANLPGVKISLDSLPIVMSRSWQ
jgi:3-dehydroquinate dehydratase / shikimate dehydrogenase